jgi:hypothetical protein
MAARSHEGRYIGIAWHDTGIDRLKFAVFDHWFFSLRRRRLRGRNPGRGWLRVVYFEKGLDYYSTNLAFIGKMAFFVAVAFLSIYPSRVFISWRKVLTRGHPPLVEADKMRSIRKLLHWELVGSWQ